MGPRATEPCSITLGPAACWPVTMECLHPGFPHLFPLLALLPGVRGGRGEEGAGSYHGVKVGVCPGVRLEGWLTLFCPLLPRWCVQGVCTIHCFYSLLFRCGCCFSVFLYLPKCGMHTVTFSLFIFFVFCSSERHWSRCKHCRTTVKGPRSQPVSVRLPMTNVPVPPHSGQQ